jgi:hypothetical protein
MTLKEKVQAWLDEYNDLNESASGIPFFEGRSLADALQLILDEAAKSANQPNERGAEISTGAQEMEAARTKQPDELSADLIFGLLMHYYTRPYGSTSQAMDEAAKELARRIKGLKRESIAPSEWYAQRHDNNDGDIEFHAYGPKESFVVFEGVNAKADCGAFMKAVGGTLHDGR